MIWRVIPDDNTRLAALQSGQGDVTQYIPYVALRIAEARCRACTCRTSRTTSGTIFIGFKVDKPVVNDPVLRRAMVMAVNRPAIAKAVFFGAGDPADAYLNPGVLDYDPKSKALMPVLRSRRRPQAAR